MKGKVKLEAGKPASRLWQPSQLVRAREDIIAETTSMGRTRGGSEREKRPR
jgi:hypothetical protein